MPTPDPAPNEAQILTVSEIAMVSYEEAETKISADSRQAVSNAKWAATLLDIASWTTGGVGRDAGDVKRVDNIEFFEGSASVARLEIRNAVRLRYGLPYMTSEQAANSDVLIQSLQWF